MIVGFKPNSCNQYASVGPPIPAPEIKTLIVFPDYLPYPCGVRDDATPRGHVLPLSFHPSRPMAMKPPFRSKQEVTINAPLEEVWAFSMDLTKIQTFHPRVVKVDLLSGKAHREPGVAYRCHLVGGKHTCIEKDVEIVPMEKIITVLPEDTFGISKILSDYVVETTFRRVSDSSTRVGISHYYSSRTFKAKLLNLIARWKIDRETQDMLNAVKRVIESRHTALR
jgi:hypothetical protein